MDDLHLTLLRTIARNARLADMDIALSWQVLAALLDEIEELRRELDRAKQLSVEMQATLETVDRPSVLEVGPPEPSDILCTCGKTFMNQRALRAHIQRSADHAWERPPPDNPVTLVCPECGKDTFGTLKGYKAHMRIVHNVTS